MNELNDEIKKEENTEEKVEIETTPELDTPKEPAPSSETPKVTKKPKKETIIMIISIVIYISIFATLSYFILKQLNPNDKEKTDETRIETISNVKKRDMIKYTLNDKDYYLGGTTKELLKNGFTIAKSTNENENYINPDSITAKTFYYDDTAYFQAALYCPSSSKCTYEESIIVKINFYKKSKVKIDDKIDFSKSKNEIIDILGEESGVYYQDPTMSVWSKSNDVGKCYYVIRHDSGGLFSLGDITDLKIGMWWYEGEAKHTIERNVKNDQEK